MKNLESMRKYTFAISVVIFASGLSLGCVAGFFIATSSEPLLRPLRQSELHADLARPHIDPLLVLATVGEKDAPRLLPLREQVNSIIDSYRALGVSVVSVYLRDYTASERFIINPQERFFPASLMKVPLLMTYLKVFDTDEQLFKKSLLFTGDHDANVKESIGASVQLKAHTAYSIKDLLEHMIIYSDNNAAELLANYLEEDQRLDFQGLLNDLGTTDVDVANDYMTIRAYALFFRVLFNASYLDRDLSEYALNLLTKTEYTDGIRSTVPSHIQVAEKFGEYKLMDSSGAQIKRELHDCGIVYFPKHPYLLCVMTTGNDLPTLQKMIREISTSAYEFNREQYAK